MKPVRLQRQRPEPRRFWIAWRPDEERSNDGVAGWRTDLARGVLVRDRAHVAPWRPPSDADLDDVVYVPAGDLAAAEGIRDLGAPVVVQVLAGEPVPATAADLLAVVDFTEQAMAGGLVASRDVPAGTHACWPLLPDASPPGERFAALCERLVDLGYAGVKAVALELSPDDRRALAERYEERFEAIFHRPPPDEALERACDEIAERHGLASTPRRPLPAAPGTRRLVTNRRIAEALARTADEARRAGGSEAEVAALLRAQRMADATPYDLEALAREGNLGVLDWLDERGRRVAQAALAGDRAS